MPNRMIWYCSSGWLTRPKPILRTLRGSKVSPEGCWEGTLMANSVTDIRKYIFAETDVIVLDANIWLLLYGPGEPTDRRTAMYSQAFVQILNSGCRIHLDALILSEVINRLARFEHELLMESGAQVPTDFKTFRDISQFSSVALYISVTPNNLLNF